MMLRKSICAVICKSSCRQGERKMLQFNVDGLAERFFKDLKTHCDPTFAATIDTAASEVSKPVSRFAAYNSVDAGNSEEDIAKYLIDESMSQSQSPPKPLMKVLWFIVFDAVLVV